MDGGQTLDVLGNRAKVHWCFPSILQSQRSLTNMVKLYIGGDKLMGLQGHHIPVFKTK